MTKGTYLLMSVIEKLTDERQLFNVNDENINVTLEFP